MTLHLCHNQALFRQVPPALQAGQTDILRLKPIRTAEWVDEPLPADFPGQDKNMVK